MRGLQGRAWVGVEWLQGREGVGLDDCRAGVGLRGWVGLRLRGHAEHLW